MSELTKSLRTCPIKDIAEMDSLSTMGGGLCCPVVGGVDGVDGVMWRCRARMEAMTSASVMG